MDVARLWTTPSTGFPFPPLPHRVVRRTRECVCPARGFSRCAITASSSLQFEISAAVSKECASLFAISGVPGPSVVESITLRIMQPTPEQALSYLKSLTMIHRVRLIFTPLHPKLIFFFLFRFEKGRKQSRCFQSHRRWRAGED